MTAVPKYTRFEGWEESEGDDDRISTGCCSYLLPSLVTSAIGTEIMHSRMCLKKLSLTSWSQSIVVASRLGFENLTSEGMQF